MELNKIDDELELSVLSHLSDAELLTNQQHGFELQNPKLKYKQKREKKSEMML